MDKRQYQNQGLQSVQRTHTRRASRTILLAVIVHAVWVVSIAHAESAALGDAFSASDSEIGVPSDGADGLCGCDCQGVPSGSRLYETKEEANKIELQNIILRRLRLKEKYPPRWVGETSKSECDGFEKAACEGYPPYGPRDKVPDEQRGIWVCTFVAYPDSPQAAASMLDQ